MIDAKKYILAQYANSPRLMAIVDLISSMICPSEDIEMLYRDIVNIETASSFGLDVWGRIVGISRFVATEDKHSERYNFSESGGSNQYPFATQSEFNFMSVDDNTFRHMIMMKALSNISPATAYNINSMLLALFRERGRAYYVKTGTMTAEIVLEFTPSIPEMYLIRHSGIIPRPAGVEVKLSILKVEGTLGFNEAKDYVGFNVGMFSEAGEVVKSNN